MCPLSCSHVPRLHAARPAKRGEADLASVLAMSPLSLVRTSARRDGGLGAMRSLAPSVGGEIGGWHCSALRGEQGGVMGKAWGSTADSKGTSACRVEAGRS